MSSVKFQVPGTKFQVPSSKGDVRPVDRPIAWVGHDRILLDDVTTLWWLVQKADFVYLWIAWKKAG